MDDVPLQATGIGHQLGDNQHLGPLQGHAPGHDQADVAAAQNDHSPAGQKALDVHQPLGRARGIDTCRTEARDVQRAPAPLPAAHGQNHGGRFDFNQTVGAVDGGDLLVLGNGQHHGVQLIRDSPVQHLLRETGGVLRAGQFLAESVQAKAVVDALVQNTAQLIVPLQNQNAAAAGIIGRNGRRQTGGTAADDCYFVLHPSRTSPILSLLTPTIRRDAPPHLVISAWLTPSSLARISITLGEQNPA